MARAPKPKPQPEAALPSITELGRMLGTIERRQSALDVLPDDRGRPESDEERRAAISKDLEVKTAAGLLYRRADALRDLIAAVPAQDLADCVVQINVAAHLLSMASACLHEQPASEELIMTLKRIMISVLPVMAATAGLDVVEYALDEVISMHEGRFPALAA